MKGYRNNLMLAPVGSLLFALKLDGPLTPK